MAWTWEFMTTMFRGLGGVLDNIVRKEGPHGFGIFPADPSKSVRLHVPANLLIAVSDTEFLDGRLTIKREANVGMPERAFFENYQDAFSWGSEGRAVAIKHIQALDDLPAEIRRLLSTKLAMPSLFEEGTVSQRAERWFINSRRIEQNGRDVLMPLAELVNHSPRGVPFDQRDGITIEGRFPTEAFVRYNVTDASGIFHSYGFASPERVCFSLPIKNEQSGLTIERSINLDTMIGSTPVPNYKADSNGLTLSCVMIGHAKFPRLSRGIFSHVMKAAGRPNADELFETILHNNRMKFLELLEKLEPLEGGLVPTLRTMARHQLEAMSYCMGTREL